MSIAPGAKLTSANFNSAFVCKTEDQEMTGRLKAKWFTSGKSTVTAATTMNLAIDNGTMVIEGTGPTDVATFTSAAPGLEDGQMITVINQTDVDITFSAIGKGYTLPVGCSLNMTYCESEFFPQVDTSGGGGGGASAINDLTDVSAAAPADNDTLCYNSATSQWESEPKATGGASVLDDLTDVDVTTLAPADCNVLAWDSQNSLWQPKEITFDLEEIEDVFFNNLADGDTLCWNDDDSEWQNVPKAAGSTTPNVTAATHSLAGYQIDGKDVYWKLYTGNTSANNSGQLDIPLALSGVSATEVLKVEGYIFNQFSRQDFIGTVNAGGDIEVGAFNGFPASQLFSLTWRAPDARYNNRAYKLWVYFHIN